MKNKNFKKYRLLFIAAVLFSIALFAFPVQAPADVSYFEIHQPSNGQTFRPGDPIEAYSYFEDWAGTSYYMRYLLWDSSNQYIVLGTYNTVSRYGGSQRNSLSLPGSLLPGQYTLNFRILDSYEWTLSQRNVQINIVGKPDTPEQPVATNITSNSVTISWKSVNSATSYELSRSSSYSGTYTVIYTGSATSYTNTGLTAGTIYYYQVRAYNGTYSNYSTVRDALTSPATPSLSLTTNGPNSITASWGSVASASSYELSRSTSSAGSYTVIYTGSATSYTDTGINSGTTYHYRVRAYNGTYSNYSTVRNALTSPAAPSLSLTVNGTNSITANWGSVSSATSYELSRSTSSSGTYNVICTGSETSFTDSGLTAGTTYYYKARASNGTYSDYSHIESATTFNSLSSDAELADLSINPSELNEPFSPDKREYTATVPNNVTSITVSAPPSSPLASVKIITNLDASSLGNNSFQIEGLDVGRNNLSVEVTAEDGTISKPYTIVFTKEPEDPKLESLEVSVGELNPEFDPDVSEYKVFIDEDVDRITFKAVAKDPAHHVISSEGGVGIGELLESIVLGPDKEEYKISVVPGVGEYETYTINIIHIASPTFKVTSAEGKRGEKVLIPVSIENSPGINMFQIAMQYDNSKLRFVSQTKGLTLTHTTNLNGDPVQFAGDIWEVQVTYSGNLLDPQTVPGDIVLCIFEFEIRTGAADGETAITINTEKSCIFDGSGKKVNCITKDGEITIDGDITVFKKPIYIWEATGDIGTVGRVIFEIPDEPDFLEKYALVCDEDIDVEIYFSPKRTENAIAGGKNIYVFAVRLPNGEKSEDISFSFKPIGGDIEKNKIIIYGDVNEDGYITTTDATLVTRWAGGNTATVIRNILAADVNGDAYLTTTDATLITRRAGGNLVVFPIETRF
jgi:fibronectin type 3 domain-containing protein